MNGMTDERVAAMLGIWAGHAPADPAAEERLAAHALRLAAAPAAPRPWRWTAGIGMAASVAVAALMLRPAAEPMPAAENAAATAAAAKGEDGAIASFALLYTPTYEEEQYL